MAKKKVETRKLSQHLKVNLTEAELLEAGEKISSAMTEKERQEANLDRIKQQFKGEISVCDGIISSNKTLICNKFEYRDVECEEFRDYESGVVTVIRLDTGEVVTERKMRDDELQKSIQFCDEGEGEE